MRFFVSKRTSESHIKSFLSVLSWLISPKELRKKMPDYDLMKLHTIAPEEEETVSDFKLDIINEEFKTITVEQDNKRFFDLSTFKLHKLEEERAQALARENLMKSGVRELGRNTPSIISVESELTRRTQADFAKAKQSHWQNDPDFHTQANLEHPTPDLQRTVSHQARLRPGIIFERNRATAARHKV
jgi:hypothetical protein